MPKTGDWWEYNNYCSAQVRVATACSWVTLHQSQSARSVQPGGSTTPRPTSTTRHLDLVRVPVNIHHSPLGDVVWCDVWEEDRGRNMPRRGSSHYMLRNPPAVISLITGSDRWNLNIPPSPSPSPLHRSWLLGESNNETRGPLPSGEDN